nr:MAG TPA: hypothetical protein [Caudoviricetes sp.]
MQIYDGVNQVNVTNKTKYLLTNWKKYVKLKLLE